MELPPKMKPARPEMLDLDCWGAVKTATLDDLQRCGRTVDLACPRCGVHRCRECVDLGEFCPVCSLTNPASYELPAVH